MAGASGGEGEGEFLDSIERSEIDCRLDSPKGTPGAADQKQALNALVFFYREVCGMEEVDLEVRLRRTERRIPVVLNVGELLALIGKLKEPYRLAAELQYGAGLRLKELVTLRIKDVVLIYTHVATGVNGLGVRSPLDVIPVGSG